MAQGEFVGSKAGGGMDGAIVSGLDVRQEEMSVILTFVHRHMEHLGEGVVEALHSPISLGVVGASGELVDPQKLIDDS